MEILDKIFSHFSSSNDSPPSLMGPSSPFEDGAADPYADHEALKARVKEQIERNEKMRWSFERLWFRAVMYYIGNQWITWDGKSRRWRERKLRKWVPKPVTNRLASTADSVIAAVQATKVMPSIWPSTDNHDDIATASVAEKVIPIIDNEIRVELLRESAANWMVLNGDAFAFCYYDKTDETLGKTTIESLMCQLCGYIAQPKEFEDSGMCPQCQAEPMLQPAVDELGQPITESYPVGRLKVDMLSPLEVYLNMDCVDFSLQDRWTIMRTYPLDKVKSKWPEASANINPDAQAATKTARHFMEALAYMSEDSGYNTSGASQKDRVTVMLHHEMPSTDYPDGLWVVMASDETILESGPSQAYDEDQAGNKCYMNPLVKIPYRQVPGRVYAKTPIYDCLPKQDQLNRLESLIELAIMKGTYGTWLLPSGSSISAISGEPATIIRYTPTGMAGAEPKVLTTPPFDAIILEWKKQIVEDFEELAGTFDALKGNVPRGVSAGYAIQLLTERSYGRFAPVFAAWERGWVDIYGILLRLFRTYATEDRLQRIKGYSGAWEIAKFKGADLKGSVDVKVEGGATKPRSKLAEQALVETLAKLGVINTQDPEQQYQITQMFGMTHILGANDDDKRHAAKEWDSFLNGQPPLVKGVIDNHIVHISDHKSRAKTDLYDAMPPDQQMAWQEHILQHMMILVPFPGAANGAKPQAGPGEPPGEGGDDKPPGNKGDEQGDQTMNQLRSGGSNTLGSGGDNQY